MRDARYTNMYIYIYIASPPRALGNSACNKSEFMEAAYPVGLHEQNPHDRHARPELTFLHVSAGKPYGYLKGLRQSDIMTISSWRSHHGDIIMTISSWRYITMIISSWRYHHDDISSRQFHHDDIIMMISSWRYHHEDIIMTSSSWRYHHDELIMKISA